MSKLNFERVEQSFRERPDWAREQLPLLQLTIFVAAGGGLVGRQYAEQPEGAYTDTRSGRLPYKQADLASIQGTLIACAKALDLDPTNLPPMPMVHACGVW